ncbi:MAG TPA: sugar phosphate isomerase/epimerase [Vicinamibacterales bacterium]|jgi:sugar phosphate isomerase/epimerase|nr:sugar phosphate isomerase/epimerase [Vicinamibacterales bacterium]
MDLSRRQVLGGAVAALGAAVVAGTPAELEAQRAMTPRKRPANEPFGYCLNTSTIRGNNLDIVAEVDAIAKAGFDGIEPWITELDAYTAKGGSLKDLGKRIADAGLVVENAIAFNSWLSDDEATRTAAMEKIKVDMDKVAQIGGTRIATPPGGGGRRGGAAPVSLDNAATYYRAALELGQTMGVTPLCELWSSHPVLGPLSHGAYVAIQAGRADASLLLDVIHLYRSGTAFESLTQVNGGALHVLHVNDYPQAPDPTKITDAQRVYPGDGLAPYGTIVRALHDNGFRGVLSIELFNRDYWAKSADENLKTGLAKIREQVKKALA